MANVKTFEPIEAARRIADSYRGYISSTIHFDDPGLQGQLESLLARDGYLAKGPFLQAAPPYTKDKSVRELVDEGVLCKGMLGLGGGDPRRFDPDRKLYEHQVKAIRKAGAGRNYAVVTGTGSGKTECFLLPILNDILREHEAGELTAGVRAILLYPMNALANDQVKRLRELVEGTPITFGRYTGDTEEHAGNALVKWNEENPDSRKLENEIISREEIRRNPPHILLTNYSMLEYLLLRPKDAPLFGPVFGSHWRHIAVDEAHVYSGALGTEVAFLIRRLKARIASEMGEPPKLHCYATSATIGSEEVMPRVAEFVQGLFGEPFESGGDDIDVITSSKDSPEDALDEEPWGMLPLGCWRELRKALLDRDDSELGLTIKQALAPAVPPEVLDRFASDQAPLLGLGRLLLGEEATGRLVRWTSSQLLDLTAIASIDKLGIKGLAPDDEGVRTLTAMVEVLSIAQRSKGVPILTSRYHSFLRAPEGLYINLRTRTLMAEKAVGEPYEGNQERVTPIYEASVCRHCGQAYILGSEESGIDGSAPVLSPRRKGSDMDDDYVPRVYYRLVPEGEELDEREVPAWLCPICGSLHNSKDGGGHVFDHDPVARVFIARGEANEDKARCGHCGYQHRYAIQPMRVSPESAGSVICYDLVREVPPFEGTKQNESAAGDDFFASLGTGEKKRAGSIICFSDRRQDAAFFAPSLDRIYGATTRRQIIREAIDELDHGEGCTLARVSGLIAEWLGGKYSGMCEKPGDEEDVAEAWVLDELSSQAARNSLDAMGSIRLEPTGFYEKMRVPDALSAIQHYLGKLDRDRFGWLTADDYAALCFYCLDNLRSQGAIWQGQSVKGLRENLGQPVQVNVSPAHKKDYLNFVGSPDRGVTENGRSRFIRKYARKLHGIELSREDATILLENLGEFLEGFVRHFMPKNIHDGDQGKGTFYLDKSLWRAYAHSEDDLVFVCNKCGCTTHVDTRGVCPTSKCDGKLIATTYLGNLDKDRFYKETNLEPALPIRIEEHTAQLSHNQALKIQSKFVQGDVNVLSCTTTFELGVDVGDLRSVFLRNVPPSVANYAQRVGRVGRRAGLPGYAITFCRLRPHDVAYFKNPESMVSGTAPVPSCYLDNEPIALRHIFAVALSEFFRAASAGGKDYVASYHAFMNLSQEEPEGLKQLRAWLESKPEAVGRQLGSVFAALPQLASSLELDDWGWAAKLVGAPGGDHGPGRLVRTHRLKYADYKRVQDALDALDENGPRAGLTKTQDSLKAEDTIGVLAGTGVLPKYGFPTDVVELRLYHNDFAPEDGLQLQRGLRQAIHEYAPGSEVVAGKELWRSRGLKLVRGQDLVTFRYASCKDCDAFVYGIDTQTPDETVPCPVCGQGVRLSQKMIVPAFGFVGRKIKGRLRNERPRSHGYTLIKFSQSLLDAVPENSEDFDGGTVAFRSASNVRLFAINPNGKKGFWICPYCGAAGEGQDKFDHWEWCKRKDLPCEYYNALGTDFTSDVLELRIRLYPSLDIDAVGWESLMWAIHTAAVQLLQIPSSEIGCTYYRNGEGSYSLMIYDNVPGGAGRAQQLSGMVDELLEGAYEKVHNCTCSEDTCCYGCIANYFNQGRQEELSRGAALRILGALLGKENSNKETESLEATTPESVHPSSGFLHLDALFDGTSLEGSDFDQACRLALPQCDSADEREFVESLARMGAEEPYELPQTEVTFADGKGGEADAMLAWRRHRIAVMSAKDVAEFKKVFCAEPEAVAGWVVVRADSGRPESVLEKLAE